MDLHPYYPLLARTPLLRGMRPDELDTLLDCFAPRVRRYARDEILLLTGYETREVGILLEGSLKVDQSLLNGENKEATKLTMPPDYVDQESSMDFLNEYKVFRGTVVCSGNAIMCVGTVGDKSVYGQIASELQTDEERDSPLKVKLGDLAHGISKFGYIGGVAIAVAFLFQRVVIHNGFDWAAIPAYCSNWMNPVNDLVEAVILAVIIIVMAVPEGLPLMVAIVSALNMGKMLKDSVLVRKIAGIETAGSLNILFSDKTGTITSGEPKVTDLIPAPGVQEEELLRLAFALEQKSEHPLARAILHRAEERNLSPEPVSDFQVLPGNGLTATWQGTLLQGGNYTFISRQSQVPESMRIQGETLAQAGKTPLFFAQDGHLTGIIAVADVIKEDSPQAIQELQSMGIQVVMLTGDNARTAQAIGKEAGVNHVIAGVLPDGKERVIRQLKEQGKVTMVGDGINDAPALTRADIGIAIGAGTDVAIDAADVVLMKSRLHDVPAAIRLSRATLRNIHQNLFWAFLYNTIGIPLAAGVFIPLGLTLNPMFGAAAMSLSSFCVVTNALRLNLFRMHDGSKDKKIKSISITVKEQRTMEKTMKIEGMMCTHCEARVKKALEALDAVEQAKVSHEAGTAVVTLSEDVTDDVLKNAVEAQDYPVTSIQ